jgi:hypothetical protein
MSDQIEQAQAQNETKLEQVDGVVFGDVTAEFKTSLAYNGEARNNEDFEEVTLAVNLAGVSLKEALHDFLAQCAVKFQRTRRAKDSNGVFESREAFDEYVDSLDGRAELHYSQVGKAPSKPMTDQEAEAQMDQLLAQMSPEARERFLNKKS